ncbi:MAG: response regulator, partial [Chloroflexi bacterium]|nr:response regulator [Chloroflexota bacterium]
LMMPQMSGYELLRRLRAERQTASLPVIMLTARGQPIDRAAAMEAGATAFLAKPVGMRELLNTVSAVLGERKEPKTSAASIVIAVTGLRGGVGATTLATNLATTWALPSDRAVCIVDLSASSGHVALHLGLRPNPNWSSLADVGQLDADAVQAYMIQHASGLHVLASPVIPVIGPGLLRGTVATLLNLLQERYAVTVVDMPSVLNDMAGAVLNAATCILQVIALEPAAVQTALGARRALETWSDRIQVVLNHPNPSDQWPADAVQGLLRQRPIGEIPFDSAQAEALKSGAPLALRSPDSPLAQAVRALAGELDHAAGDAHSG